MATDTFKIDLDEYREYESEMAYVAGYNTTEYTEHYCPSCNYPVIGVGLFSTGGILSYPEGTSYQPQKHEWLKNVWMRCVDCGWDQYS